MKNYIFDLDYTLYSSSDVDLTNTTIFYNSFKKKNLLNKLLKNLNGNKFIFSNGNKSHVDYLINKMKFNKIFKNIANSDEYKHEKPHLAAYEYVIKKFNIDPNDITYFFEDSVENLETAKKYGWKTVLIDEEGISDDYQFVDYKFKSIEQALIFFIHNKI